MALLGRHSLYEWIEQAMDYTGKANIRKGRLPAEQVGWLVIASTVYRHQSIGEVAGGLDLMLLDLQTSCVSNSIVP